MKIPTLVVDSAPIIKSALKLGELAENITTVPEVLAELKDEATRAMLTSLPYVIKTKTPSEVFMKQIVAFSKQTGDFASLSLTDLKVLALTLQLETEVNGIGNLRMEPLPNALSDGKRQILATKPLNSTPTKSVEHTDRLQASMSELSLKTPDSAKQPSKNQNEDTENKPDSENQPDKNQTEDTIQNEKNEETPKVESLPQTKDLDSQGIESDDDSDGDWITPSSLAAKKQREAEKNISMKKARNVQVACITNDFAMQNVLLQMKLNLVNVDGLQITRLKNWVLRCHACFKITKLMDKVFCPTCGNNTLIRTSVSIDKDGKMTIYLKKNFQYNNRGTRYSIPTPQSGKKANNLILREDQREHEKALQLKKRFDKKAMYQDLGNLDSLLSLEGGSRLSSTGRPIIGYGRKNINEVKKGRRRK